MPNIYDLTNLLEMYGAVTRQNINRVEMGLELENEFLHHEITKTYKKNTFVGKALEEMSGAEKAMLFSNSGEPESVITN